MPTKAGLLLEHWEQHRQYRDHQVPVWQELGDFIQPHKTSALFRRVPSGPSAARPERLFDSTAVHANILLSASMQGALTSGTMKWFGLRIRGIEIAKDSQLALDLEWCAGDMYDTIHQSNHNSEFSELYQDMTGFGLGGVMVEEKAPRPGQPFGGLLHIAMHPGEYCIEENAEGLVDTLYREFELTARAAVKKFGNGVGSVVANALSTTPTQRFKFLQVISPSDDPQPGPYSRKQYLPWKSCYVDVESQKVMSEGGYHEPPFMTPRWSKRSGEVYGWGPGHTALPDIKTLNKMKELYLRGLALRIQPPVKVRDQGVIGTVKLQPAGLIHVRDMEAVQALDTGVIRAGEFEIDIAKTQGDIRRIFFSDQLQLQEGPQMTAYEVQVRYELMQRILGPTLGRVEVELLNPYLERIFFMKLRRSAKDSAYRRIAEWCKKNGVALDIEYEGPLAKAQRLQESVATQRFFQIVLPLAEANPDVLDLINMEETVRMHATATGVPMRILNDEDTVAALKEGRKQAREQEAKAKNLEAVAGVAGKISPMLEALKQVGGLNQSVQSPAIVPGGTGV